MEKRNKNKKSGFTLIELVVVIAIIGVLAAVITPRVRLSLAKAKDSRAIAIVDALRTASNVYYAEQGTPIFAGTTAGDINTGVAALVTAKYLDENAANKFKASGVLDVGSVTCATTSITTGTITLTPDADKIGVRVNGGSTSTDTAQTAGCENWKDK